MSEFIMPAGDNQVGIVQLDPFVRGYIEALFFTQCNEDNEGMEDMTFGDIDGESLVKLIAECTAFQSENESLIEEAINHGGYDGDYSYESAGRDFWLTRNGHGVGFWDRGLGETGEALAKKCGHSEVYIEAGDDGNLYVHHPSKYEPLAH